MNVVFFLFLILNIVDISGGEIYYVSKNGDDDNEGSKKKPWQTLNKANDVLLPGDIVYIRGGVYKESINPSRSGEKGKYIIYSSYENEEVFISGVSLAINLDNKNYIKIRGFNLDNINQSWIRIEGCFNIVEKCNFIANENFRGYAGISLTGGGSRNQIIQNIIIGSTVGPHDLIYIRSSSYNLIKNNEINGGLHNGISISGKSGRTSHNIVTGNTISNPWHTSISLWKNADYTIIENNYILDAGRDHYKNFYGSERDRNLERPRHKGVKVGGSNNIIRNNIIANNGVGIGVESYDGQFPSLKNRVYNNIFFKNYYGFSVGSPGPVDDIIIKNNLFNFQLTSNIKRSSGNLPYSIKIINNFFSHELNDFAPVGPATIAFYESKFPNYWERNIVDPANRELQVNDNLDLVARGKLKSKGDFMTTTSSSGSGNKLQVHDPLYFTDGFGVKEGDIIQLEVNKGRARIIEIKHNILKLDRSLTWETGEGVSLPFFGESPPVGIFDQFE